jgi:hypothetical protein
VVGSTTADSSGRFSVTVAIPADAPAGAHHFDAAGPDPSGVITTLSAPVRVASLTHHHSWVIPAVMIVLTVLISAGAWVATSALPRGRRLTQGS